jgi:hypothetical protein
VLGEDLAGGGWGAVVVVVGGGFDVRGGARRAFLASLSLPGFGEGEVDGGGAVGLSVVYDGDGGDGADLDAADLDFRGGSDGAVSAEVVADADEVQAVVGEDVGGAGDGPEPSDVRRGQITDVRQLVLADGFAEARGQAVASGVAGLALVGGDGGGDAVG